MKYQLIMVVALLSGCATSEPYPALVGNNYYMVGGPACVKWREHNSGSHIACGDAKDVVTGMRYPMTPQQMQMYTYQQQAAQAQQSNYVYQPQMIQPNIYTPMQTPQPANLNHGSNQVRCISTGIYMNCR